MLKQFKQERSPPDVQLLKPNNFIFAGFTNLPFHVNEKLLKYPCNITPSWDNTPFDTLGCLCLPLHKHTGNTVYQAHLQFVCPSMEQIYNCCILF